MPLASQYRPEERIFAMHVGRSGHGKSVAAASYPKKYLNLDFDLRFGGIANAINTGLLTNEGIEYQQFAPKGGWEPVEKWLTQQVSYRMSGIFPYKTIEVASLTNLTRVFINYSRGLTKGKLIGTLRMPGPADWNVEKIATHDFFDELRTFPCNIICSAHIVDKYGRVKTDDNEYPQSEIIGEKLSVTDNLGENVLTYFDNIFRFSSEIAGKDRKYFVEFSTDLAKNAYGIPPGKHDITNKQFYPYLQELIAKYKKAPGETKK